MLKDILAIAGQPGLYKIVTKGSKNLIVESLASGKRIPAHSTNKIIALEDIAIFTTDGEVQLKEVLKLISEKEDGKASIDHKSSGNVLKKYFSEVLPNFDEDRVYVSDIKKVIQWYNILQEKDMLSFEEEEEESKEEENTKE
ncbi:MAG: DUF5606 domain-containing protein [Prolixibacteraceae bacterium]|nr:DUF5606 domain-containing protein [Prolixibacteraceae bacterium]MBN2648463.1 DUF5606 domain-containing protein [Prolixibacteraceae bacterium]